MQKYIVSNIPCSSVPGALICCFRRYLRISEPSSALLQTAALPRKFSCARHRYTKGLSALELERNCSHACLQSKLAPFLQCLVSFLSLLSLYQPALHTALVDCCFEMAAGVEGLVGQLLPLQSDCNLQLQLAAWCCNFHHGAGVLSQTFFAR